MILKEYDLIHELEIALLRTRIDYFRQIFLGTLNDERGFNTTRWNKTNLTPMEVNLIPLAFIIPPIALPAIRHLPGVADLSRIFSHLFKA